MSWPLLAITTLYLGCAGSQPTAAEPAPAPPRASPEAQPVARSLAARARLLPQTATFADLVEAARALDTGEQARSAAGCLIAASDPPRLEADLLVAARPLAEPAAELASLLERAAGPPTVLTAWGTLPGELPEIALNTFTTTTPRSARLPAIAVVLTAAGTFVRGAAMPLRARPEALEPQVAAELLAQVPDPAAVYVSAEAGIPLDQVIEALRSIPNRFEVALAVALPRGTRLPAAAARSQELLCPDGLPEPGEEAAEGSLDAATLRQVLAPLRDAALSCALGAGGAALRGGRLELGLRIGPEGRLQEACAVSDSIGEPVLRRCVIEAVRGLRFPTPDPAGFVDAQLPLELDIAGPPAQRPLCGP